MSPSLKNLKKAKTAPEVKIVPVLINKEKPMLAKQYTDTVTLDTEDFISNKEFKYFKDLISQQEDKNLKAQCDYIRLKDQV